MIENQFAPLKRIVAVNDLSGLGKCSLTVALPVISATGVECSCIPTALLSTHTGEFENFIRADLSEYMLPIADHWQSIDLKVNGIYSGYLASPEQGEMLESIFDRLAGSDTLLIVDPVMADCGAYYHSFDDEMCRTFIKLCRRAHIITPNITEAALLTGSSYKAPPHCAEYIDEILDRLLELGPDIAALTGVQTSSDKVGVAAKSRSENTVHFSARPLRPGIFYGTGDLFASSFSALMVRGASLSDALETATTLVSTSIDRSVRRNIPRRFGVDFEGALGSYIRNVELLFSQAADN